MAKRNSYQALFGWLAIVAALAAASTLVWSNSVPDEPASLLPTARVARGAIERTVVATGVLQPYEFVDVGTMISGQLSSLKVKLGDRVAKGQLLAEIDPEVNHAKVIEAEGTLENLQAQRRAKAEQSVLAELQSKRGELLLREDALARAEAEVLASNRRVALAAVRSLDAQIKQARAQLQTARANLAFTRIVAPMEGEVVSITARAGQTLNANQQTPTILRVARLEMMTVWAQVAEGDVISLRQEQEVYFSVLGEPDRRRVGRIRQILPAPEILNNVVFYNALFDVPNPDGALKVQMTAQVFFVVDRDADALLVPLAALRPDKSGARGRNRVEVLREDGGVDARTIQTGIKNGASVQVVSGLREGESVLVGETASKRQNKKAGFLSRLKFG